MEASAARKIRWNQVLALLALDLAIIISWIAYNKYQPALLVQFRLEEFGVALAIVQGLILFLTPPAAGYAADRLRRKGGTRLPVITIGINFVSMVFMVVALTVFADPNGTLRALFPLLVVLWLISMNIFHSPAISMVETMVPANKLPQVIALFAVVMEACQALEPSIIDMIEYFGGPLTFAVGGALVFGTGLWFSRVAKDLLSLNNEGAGGGEHSHAHDHGGQDHSHDHSGHDHSGNDHSHDHSDHSHDHSSHDHSHDHSDHDHSSHDHSGHDHSGHDHSGHSHDPYNPPRERSNFFLVFVLGTVLGVATTFFFDIFPDWSEQQLRFVGPSGDIKGGYFISILIAFAALITYPLGLLAQKAGIRKMASTGTFLAVFTGFGLSFASGDIAMTYYVLFPIAFAIMTVTYLPIAFGSIAKRQMVLGVGIFFSGVELAASTVDVLQAMG